MHDRFTVADIDEEIARRVFARNIANSQRVITGDFETPLADLIEQFEQPPLADSRMIPLADLSKRIARALRQGFAGLPPNGFEFCAWLWDVAPLHVVGIPQLNDMAASRAYHTGVIHLRKIAAMVLGLYVIEQPQRVPSLIPMLDSSVDWVDARNLIVFSFLDHYVHNFEEEYASLLRLAGERRLMRKLLPLGVAARAVLQDSSYTPMSLALLTPTFEAIGDSSIYSGITYALRSAALYGDHHALGLYVAAQRHQGHPAVRRVIAEAFRLPRMRWAGLAEDVLPVLRDWMSDARVEEKGRFQSAINAMESCNDD